MRNRSIKWENEVKMFWMHQITLWTADWHSLIIKFENFRQFILCVIVASSSELLSMKFLKNADGALNNASMRIHKRNVWPTESLQNNCWKAARKNGQNGIYCAWKWTQQCHDLVLIFVVSSLSHYATQFQ